MRVSVRGAFNDDKRLVIKVDALLALIVVEVDGREEFVSGGRGGMSSGGRWCGIGKDVSDR